MIINESKFVRTDCNKKKQSIIILKSLLNNFHLPQLQQEKTLETGSWHETLAMLQPTLLHKHKK